MYGLTRPTLRFFLPKRWLVQTILFYALILLVSLPGLRPWDSQRLVLFLPLVLVYAFLLRALLRGGGLGV